MTSRERRMLEGAGLLWIAAILSALGILSRYSGATGSPGQPPAAWPAESALPRPDDRAVLLLFAHPRCPCTSASLAELERVLARVRDRAKAVVVFLRPRAAPRDWARTELWVRAAALPGAEAVEDEDGAEARRFGVATSGHVLLFSSDGRTLFSGGITPARGHEGDSEGKAAVLARLLNGSDRERTAAVFGCALFRKGESDERND